MGRSIKEYFLSQVRLRKNLRPLFNNKELHFEIKPFEESYDIIGRQKDKEINIDSLVQNLLSFNESIWEGEIFPYWQAIILHQSVYSIENSKKTNIFKRAGDFLSDNITDHGSIPLSTYNLSSNYPSRIKKKWFYCCLS